MYEYPPPPFASPAPSFMLIRQGSSGLKPLGSAQLSKTVTLAGSLTSHCYHYIRGSPASDWPIPLQVYTSLSDFATERKTSTGGDVSSLLSVTNVFRLRYIVLAVPDRLITRERVLGTDYTSPRLEETLRVTKSGEA